MDIPQEAARGLTDIESFLYRQATLRRARQRVLGFTASMPDLTSGQKADIEGWYLEEQVYVARMVTQHIADKVGAAEERYRHRLGYWLRGTLAAAVLLTVAASVAFTLVLTAHG